MSFDIFFLPFMQRAVLGGLLVAMATSVVGIFAVLRKASFFGDAISHAALAGVAIGLLFHLNPFFSGLLFSLLLSISFPYLEKKSNLHIDAILGLTLPVSMAMGILILSLTPGYKPELISFLFGNILSISWSSIIFIAVITLIAFILIIAYKGRLVATAFDPVYAKITGINVLFFTILHNVLLTLAIVPSISVVGVVLANALLIIPAATTRQISTSLKTMFILTPILALGATLVGMYISVIFNVPTGPVIVTVLGICFIGTLIGKRLVK